MLLNKMFSKVVLITLLLTDLSLIAKDKISLQVLDKDNGLVLQEAFAIIGKDKIAYAQEGKLSLVKKELATKWITIYCPGYISKVFEKDSLFAEEGKNIFLTKEVLDIEAAKVVGQLKAFSENNIGKSLLKKDIERSKGSSLSSILTKIGGVSSISTGTIEAQPVIQGMYGNRIIIYNNGLRQSGQNWNVEHAPEISIGSSDIISVVKGSDAVRYGSDALGGIIIMEQSPLLYGEQNIKGNFSQTYGTNGRIFTSMGQLEGSFESFPGFAWRLRGSYINGGDRSTANYLLNNTGIREGDLSTSLGYRYKAFSMEVFYSYFQHKAAIMYCSSLGSEDLLAERIKIGRPLLITPFSRNINVPYHKVFHHNVLLKLGYNLKDIGKLLWNFSYQKDLREEFQLRRLSNETPSVSLNLSSFQNYLRWNLPYKIYNFEIGLQTNFTNNYSMKGTGFVPIIPNYVQTQVGVYGIAKIKRSQGGLEAGIRAERQCTEAKGYNWLGQLYGSKGLFKNISYSVSGHYLIFPKLVFRSSFASSWRAPNVFELYSNGNQLESGLFMIGNKDMKEEKGYKFISSLEFKNHIFTFRTDAFVQLVKDYIYDEPQKETITVLSGTYPIFKYKQTTALFRGFDCELTLKPLKDFKYSVKSTYIRANEYRSKIDLPFIQPFRLYQEISYNYFINKVIKGNISINHLFVAKQNHFNPQKDLIGFSPEAYNLFGFYADISFSFKEKELKLMLSGDNILNKEYKEYTNRARYYAHDAGRDLRFSLTFIF